jgi:hypothetical protein
MRLFLYALVAVLLASLPDVAAADALSDAFRAVQRNPADTQANLRYARLAEAAGLHRLAYATYERVVQNDPNNQEAREGLQRTRTAILPAVTLVTLEYGGIYESNPRQVPTGMRAEGQAYAGLTLRDERTVGAMRWRTTGTGVGIYHFNEHDLSYAYGGLNTGPVFDLGPNLTMHAALGGGASYFDNRFYYGEAIASLTFEGNTGELLHMTRLRVAYRDHNDFFPSQEGFYADAFGRYVIPSFESSYLILSPWLRWSDISGIAVSPATLIDVQPGAYFEWGQKVEYHMLVFEGTVVGVSGAVAQRYYRSDLASFSTTDKRADTLYMPGAMLWFPRLFGGQSGLRIDYTYIWNDTNFVPRRYVDHIVGAAVLTKF